MTLDELIGPGASQPGPVVGYWYGIGEWCLGENDTFGTCGFAGIGNLHAVVTNANGTLEVMSDGEIELMDHDVTGFMPTDRTTDHGVALEVLLKYWQDHGWAGDPTLVPVGWVAIDPGEIHRSVHSLAGAYVWARLPSLGGQWDLTDAALNVGIEGTAPHCMQIVGSGPGYYYVVTWGVVRKISHAWWAKYGMGQYAVRHPEWRIPTS